MALFIESIEVEELRKLIEEKRENHKRASSDFWARKYQSEIMFLQRILPIIQRNTDLEHNEICKYIINAYEKATKPELDFDGMLIYLNFHKKQFPDKVAVLNEGEKYGFGTIGANSINLELRDLSGAYLHPTLIPVEYL